MLTKRVNTLSESITIAITTLAQELKAEGKDILSFSAGEPDFGTPQVIKDAAIAAINNNFTKYTAVDGIPALREAIANKLKRDNGLTYAPNQIMVNNGAKHSLFNLFAATIENGAEVIIPSPYWVTYPELVNYCGGKVVEIETHDTDGFKITPEQLQAAITDKTRMLILTSPSNPTGSIYTKDELVALGKVLEGTEIIVASDEMYEKLTYDTELIKATKKLQSQSTSNINSITQMAAIAGLDGSADADIEMMRKAFIERRNEAVELINKIDGLSVLKPDGAFYLFVNIKEISSDSLTFAKELLDKKLVAVVPGVAFGSEGYFRLSFATDIDTIRDGISRIAEFVKEMNS